MELEHSIIIISSAVSTVTYYTVLVCLCKLFFTLAAVISLFYKHKINLESLGYLPLHQKFRVDFPEISSGEWYINFWLFQTTLGDTCMLKLSSWEFPFHLIFLPEFPKISELHIRSNAPEEVNFETYYGPCTSSKQWTHCMQPFSKCAGSWKFCCLQSISCRLLHIGHH